MDKGRVVGAVFLSPRKTFDTVNYTVQLNKHLNFSLSMEFLNLAKSYPSSLSQPVKNFNHTCTPYNYNWCFSGLCIRSNPVQQVH